MAIRRGRVIRAASRRETVWFGFAFTSSTVTGAGGNILTSLNAAALALRPFTIVRTHMAYQVVSDQAAAIEVQAGAIAMAVVSDQAVAIGVTAVPTPVTDAGSDLFFMYRVFHGDESNLTDRAKSGTRFEVDSKAMRRVDVGEDIVQVLELSTSGQGFTFAGAGRMLVKLH